MPLKHSTETFLVAVLALLLALTGFVLAVLPPIPAGSLLWAASFFLSLVYPLALIPLLRSARADNAFRWLHFSPAILLVVWLLLQIGDSYSALFSLPRTVFTWGWSLVPVLIVLGLIAAFCLQVIRQRFVRLLFLVALSVPFVVLAFVGEYFSWPSSVSSLLRTKDQFIASSRPRLPLMVVGGSSSAGTAVSSQSSAKRSSSVMYPILSQISSISASSKASSVSSSAVVAQGSSASYDREAYRRRMYILNLAGSSGASLSSQSRASLASSSIPLIAAVSSSSVATSSTASSVSSSQGYFSRLYSYFFGPSQVPSASSVASSASSSSASSLVAIVSSTTPSSLSSMPATVRSSSSSSSLSPASSAPALGKAPAPRKPRRLAQTGFGLGEAGLLVLALYCGVLHARARRRAIA